MRLQTDPALVMVHSHSRSKCTTQVDSSDEGEASTCEWMCASLCNIKLSAWKINLALLIRLQFRVVERSIAQQKIVQNVREMQCNAEFRHRLHCEVIVWPSFPSLNGEYLPNSGEYSHCSRLWFQMQRADRHQQVTNWIKSDLLLSVGES